MKIVLTTLAAALMSLTFSACTPEPGTKAWCDNMKQKEKGKWTAEEAGTFAKHCVMGNYKE